MLCAQSTTKDYIRAENKLQPVYILFNLQVINPQEYLFVKQLSVEKFHEETDITQHTSHFIQHTNFSWKAKTTLTILKCQLGNTIAHVLKPIPRALNTGTCLSHLGRRAGSPVSFCGPTQKPALATGNTGKTRERFWKNEANGPGTRN